MPDLIINVKVKVRQNNFSIKKEGDVYRVSLTSVPEKGKANTELLKMLRKLTKRECSIISGYHSQNKKILIKDISSEEFDALLS